jgi:hypothetical protein
LTVQRNCRVKFWSRFKRPYIGEDVRDVTAIIVTEKNRNPNHSVFEKQIRNNVEKGVLFFLVFTLTLLGIFGLLMTTRCCSKTKAGVRIVQVQGPTARGSEALENSCRQGSPKRRLTPGNSALKVQCRTVQATFVPVPGAPEVCGRAALLYRHPAQRLRALKVLPHAKRFGAIGAPQLRDPGFSNTLV